LLRYCARPPFALERLSVSRGPDGRITRVRYVLPRHKAANGVGPGRGRTSTRPGANGVVELTPPRVPRSFGGPCPAAAEAPALLSRGVCAESQAAKSRHGDGDREHRQAVRRRCRRSTSTASEPCRGRGHNKEVRPPDSERLRAETRRRHFRGERGRFREPLSGPRQPREAGAIRSRAAHQSGNACGSAIGRAILFQRNSWAAESIGGGPPGGSVTWSRAPGCTVSIKDGTASVPGPQLARASRRRNAPVSRPGSRASPSSACQARGRARRRSSRRSAASIHRPGRSSPRRGDGCQMS
jgi:hypothetical protein